MIDTPAAEVPSSIAAAMPAPPQALPLRFTGRGGEYFRIWIVNLFLTIVTVGLYSAWAKVRRRRYFCGHTWLEGSNFEYHGDPVAILRGRLIAVALFLAYTLLGNYSPRLAAVAALVALPAAPWLLVRSFRFNAANTSYRNVRFGFDGRYAQVLAAILPVVVFPLTTVIFGRYDPNGARTPTAAELVAVFLPLAVFALAYPWMSGRLHLLRVTGSRFGATRFQCDASVGEFYALYLIAGFVGLGLGIVFFAPIGIAAAMIGRHGALPTLAVMVAAAYLALVTCMLGYTQSRLANLVYNQTTLGEPAVLRLRSTLRFRTLAGIYFTNAVAIVFTLGLAIPWAAVRVARARAVALEVEADGDLDAFVAGATQQVAATGEEVGELFAFDVAL